MKRTIAILATCFLLFSLNGLYSQILSQIDTIFSQSDTSALRQMYDRVFLQTQDSLSTLPNRAFLLGIAMEDTLFGGGPRELMSLDGNNFPTFYITDNYYSCQTVSRSPLRNIGSPYFGVEGQMIKVGLWDYGIPYSNHPDLFLRVENMDQSSDHYHATHIAGTIIGDGNQNALARGFATSGKINAWDWDYDISEIILSNINLAQSLSNHSYSKAMGWIKDPWNTLYWLGDVTVSSFEDYRFGFYSDFSARIDSICRYAPYRTIVKSAGNERAAPIVVPGTPHWYYDPITGQTWSTDTRADDCSPNGYDGLGDFAVAKNIITVGSIEDIILGYQTVNDAQMSSYSSWGPTDDGRIKPDLVAGGTLVKSTFNPSDGTIGDDGNGCFGQYYCTFSGTSMAAPAIAGSISILQEIYSNTHNLQLMTSAEVKALLIHTSDEAGSYPGPDYQFGWGVANIEKSAEIIEIDQNIPATIQTGLLVNGLNSSQNFYYSGLGDPEIKATLVWTDIPAIPLPKTLDPTNSMLVNDLDLRIIRVSDGQVFYPWKTDFPNSLNSPATKGDNSIDNVEVVQIENPTPGDYRVEITNKGNLWGMLPQKYALIISGISSQPLAVDFPRKLDIEVFPNPSDNWVEIHCSDELALPLHLELLNSLGIVIGEIEMKTSSQKFQTENLPSGFYWLRVLNTKSRIPQITFPLNITH